MRNMSAFKNCIKKLSCLPYLSFVFLAIVFLIPLQKRYDKPLRSFAVSILNQDISLPALFDRSLYFYITDLLILFLLICTVFSILRQDIRWRSFFFRKSALYLSLFVLFSFVSILTSSTASYYLHYFRFFHLLLAVLLFNALVNGLFFTDTKKWIPRIFWTLVLTTLIQCLIGIAQYMLQNKLGLSKWGEAFNFTDRFPSHFIMSDGSKWLLDRFFCPSDIPKFVIRAYGTLPHPNVLGGFVFLGSIATYYLYYQTQRLSIKIVLSLAIFIELFTLCITYSRSAIFAWLMGTTLLLALIIFKIERRFSSKTKALFCTIFISGCICIALFYAQFFQRGGIVGSNEVSRAGNAQRMEYFQMSLEMIKKNPIAGVGMNNFVVRMQDFAPSELNTHQFQAVHSIYFLIASEEGLIGLVLFALFLFSLIRDPLRTKLTPLSAMLLSIFAGFLFIGCCDYYFLVYQQGRLMFFIAAGLLAYVGSQSSSSHEIVKKQFGTSIKKMIGFP